MKKLAKQILRKLKLQRIGQEQFVADINRDYTNPEQKKVLICYLDYLRTVSELRSNFGHTNRQEMMQMVKVCVDDGWCVDVCGCNDSSAVSFIRENDYDVILGFGSNFSLAVSRNPHAFSIIYMTENPYTISYQREKQRINYFAERTGRRFRLERTGVYYRKNDEKQADAVLCLGDERYFPESRRVVRIWPSALKNPTFRLDFAKKKKTNFLVYGVDGFVHKGNDLLVEIFENHPEWNLFLCGRRGKEKATEAGYRLPDNVHAVGYVDTLSGQFNEIAAQCYYLLLPSCSEAPSTSVLTGMRHGLLPIVSKGIGLDGLDAYCRYFPDFHIEAVERTLAEASGESEERLQAESKAIMEYADAHYKLSDFTEQFRAAWKQLTDMGERVG